MISKQDKKIRSCIFSKHDFKSGQDPLFWPLHIPIEVAYAAYWAMKIYKLSITLYLFTLFVLLLVVDNVK